MAYQIGGTKKPQKHRAVDYRSDTAPVQPNYFAEEYEVEDGAPGKTSALTYVFRVLFTLVLAVLFVGTVAFAMLPDINTVATPKTLEGKGILKTEDLNLNDAEKEVYAQKKGDTLNILCIGVDGVGYKDTRSDVMMVMSINRQTKQIHLVSIQRDTLAYLPLHDSYEKLNHSFAYDGAVGTMKAINQNYDLDIESFVVFDYNALEQMVDAIGGVVVDIDQNEYDSMIESLVTPPGTGEQLLNGKEALIYARVRNNAGGDPGRNERQREILMYIFKEAKSMSFGTMKDLAYALLPNIQTSYDYGEILSMLKYFETIKSASDITPGGFPFDQEGAMLDDGLAYVIPVTLEENVIKLHRLLYGFDGYKPSDRVLEYNREIGNRSGLY